MSFRTALRAARPLASLPRFAGSASTPTAARSAAIAFRRGFNESAPVQFNESSPVGKDDENGQYSPGYEEHREQIENPKFAGVDDSVTFRHPTVSLLATVSFGAGADQIAMAQRPRPWTRRSRTRPRKAHQAYPGQFVDGGQSLRGHWRR